MSRPKRTNHRKTKRPNGGRQHHPPTTTANDGADKPARRPFIAVATLILGVLIGAGLTELPRLRPCQAEATAQPRKDPVSNTSARPPGEASPASTDDRPHDGAAFRYSQAVFERLDHVRREKKTAILELLADVEDNARRIVHDETMLDCFDQMLAFHGGSAESATAAPAKLKQALEEYHQAIIEHYALNYSCFYDILFVSSDRFVIHTIRKEADYHSHLDDDSHLGRALKSCLAGSPHEVVVDYHYYAPSDRPSAFFVLPLIEAGVHRGWFVLQYTIKMLDSLMVDHQELGVTGEVYLVNQHHLMLTDSKMSGEQTHLKLKVQALVGAEASAPASGRGLDLDYSGRRVFYAYERLTALGQTWILVAQIDEAEVITDYFRRNQSRCRDSLLEQLAARSLRPRPDRGASAPCRLVCMDEFIKAGPDQALRTRGVSTCTAVAVLYPGRFSYLAHISAYDKIYGSCQLTNLLKQLINTITYYDICRNELERLQVVVIATHLKSIDGILSKLLRYGITLDQVRFAYNPQAWYANAVVASRAGEVTVTWTYEGDAAPPVTQWAVDIPTLADVLRNVARLPRPSPPTPSSPPSAESMACCIDMLD